MQENTTDPANNFAKQTENTPPTKRSYKKPLAILWLLFFLAWIGAGLFFLGVSCGLLGELPSIKELENPDNALATEVYYTDGSLMGKYFYEDRSNVTYEEIAPETINTLIATEDVRFYGHAGIDLYGLSTAIYRMIFQGKTAGASTISQQLAKNLFHERSGSSFVQKIKQKFKEWVIAVRLEKNYTKREILTMYLNTVPFSSNAFGIKSAAKTYFGKAPNELGYNESAFLVGMLKGSTMYNPKSRPKQAKGRRNVVLGQLIKQNHITEAQKDSISQLEYDVSLFKRSSHLSGNANYFREYLREYLKKWAKEHKKMDGTTYDVYDDGLKIYTTLDANMQRYAEEAMSVHMKSLQASFDEHWKGRQPWEDDPVTFLGRAIKQSERYRVMKRVEKKSDDEIDTAFDTPVPMRVFSWNGDIDTTMTPLDSLKYYKKVLQSGLLSMNPRTGEVKAWVGGINFNHFKYDSVRPEAKRQVGSTFKPFVYTLAIQNGYSPCQKMLNSPITIPKGKYGLLQNWTPRGKSSDKLDNKELTLKVALANSLNWVSAKIMNIVGPKPVVDITRRMGIKSDIPEVPAIALGAADISLYEMVGAYSTFANKGTYTQPLFITRIEDKNGQIIEEFVPQRTEAIGEQHAYIMLNLMKGVKDSGTGRRLIYKYGYKSEHDIAGKTGTTNDNSDGWFMGITPNLVSGVWTGGDEKVIHFRSTSLGQGANMALPIWAEYMTRVHADESTGVSVDDKFDVPERLSIELNCAKYERYKLNLDDYQEEVDSSQIERNQQLQDEMDGF